VARRKTIQEKKIEATITKHLNELGRKITVLAGRNSKVSKLQKDHLRDSGNYRVKPYNVLTVSQNYYGKFNTPKGKPTTQDRDRLKDTPMQNSIRENTEDGVKVLIKDLVTLLKSPIVTKK
jgi:hypothetical protein